MTDSGEQAKQASLQDLYEGARRDATYWNKSWHASHFAHAAEREKLEARLAASEAEVADLKTVRDGQKILIAAALAAKNLFAAERDSLRDKLAKLAEYVQHPGHCSIFLPMPMKFGQTYSNEDFAQWREKQVCNCGLAAIQSSEKG